MICGRASNVTILIIIHFIILVQAERLKAKEEKRKFSRPRKQADSDDVSIVSICNMQPERPTFL